jgi:hypothetical protein
MYLCGEEYRCIGIFRASFGFCFFLTTKVPLDFTGGKWFPKMRLPSTRFITRNFDLMIFRLRISALRIIIQNIHQQKSKSSFFLAIVLAKL